MADTHLDAALGAMLGAFCGDAAGAVLVRRFPASSQAAFFACAAFAFACPAAPAPHRYSCLCPCFSDACPARSCSYVKGCLTAPL
jgi:hypothetical protein